MLIPDGNQKRRMSERVVDVGVARKASKTSKGQRVQAEIIGRVENLSTVGAADQPAAVPQPPSHQDVKSEADSWGSARPLGSTECPAAGEVSDFQLSTLRLAQSLRNSVQERLPPRTVGCTVDEKGGVGVWREVGGHLCMSVLLHPNAAAEALVDVNFYDTWRADISIRCIGLGVGLLPLLACMRDSELIPKYLPYVSGLPNIERLEIAHEFNHNDWMYHCLVTPFGPLPGADDVHNFSLYDLIDVEGEECIMGFAISPQDGEAVYRGWEVPPVKSWRRKRNYVYGATLSVRPSDTPPVRVKSSSESPPHCCTPGCPYYAHSCLSVGSGTLVGRPTLADEMSSRTEIDIEEAEAARDAVVAQPVPAPKD